MATITTTASLIRQYNAFTGLSALERSQSGVARAEVVYYNVNDSWGAPGAGNDRIYQSGNTDLPKDFGYVLTDVFIEVTADTTIMRAEAAGSIRLYPGGILGPQINVPIVNAASRQDPAGGTAIGSIQAQQYNSVYPSNSGAKASMIFRMDSKPTPIIYPFNSNSYTSSPNPASVFNVALSEAFQNGDAYEVSAYLRFLQYDIDQSFNYVIQSPQLTR